MADRQAKRPRFPSYAAVGLLTDYAPFQTEMDPAGKFVLASGHRKSEPFRTGLWVRAVDKVKYTTLCGFDRSDLYYQSSAFEFGRPVVHLNVMIHTPTVDVEGNTINGYNWYALETYDLATRELLNSTVKLVGPEPATRIWISKIVGCSAKRAYVLANVGFELKNAGGKSGYVAYRACEIDVQTGICSILGDFKGIFV